MVHLSAVRSTEATADPYGVAPEREASVPPKSTATHSIGSSSSVICAPGENAGLSSLRDSPRSPENRANRQCSCGLANERHPGNGQFRWFHTAQGLRVLVIKNAVYQM